MLNTDFSLYVHFPLCRSRCGYCDFPIVVINDFPHAGYADKILEEARWRAPNYAHGRLKTLYFGGGTPSLWHLADLRRVINGLLECFDVDTEIEITLEANPSSLSADHLSALRDVGVNRLSLGTQSLDDKTLRALTRDHLAERGRTCVHDARSAGFTNISCDAMVGLAGVTMEASLRDIARIADLNPDHLSIYGLTLARGSALWRNGLRVGNDDDVAECLVRIKDSLEVRGFVHYEVSNFSPDSKRSKHNQLTWKMMPSLALGAAAHSLVLQEDDHYRLINPPFSRYLDASVGEVAAGVRSFSGARGRHLDPATAAFEMLMLGIRCRDGVSRRGFRARFGFDPDKWFASGLSRLQRAGMIEADAHSIRPTGRGIWFADTLALEIWSSDDVPPGRKSEILRAQSV